MDAEEEALQRLVSEKGGRVLFMGYEGSKRYGLDLPGSDSDFVAVVAGHATEVVGEDGVWCTDKTAAGVSPDVSFVEAGGVKFDDYRMVESVLLLATAPETVVGCDAGWERFWRRWGEVVVTKQYVENYLSEAEGRKGVKQLKKNNGKKQYITMRMLFSALTAASKGEPLLRFDTVPILSSFLTTTRTGVYPDVPIVDFCEKLISSIRSNTIPSDFPPTVTSTIPPDVLSWCSQWTPNMEGLPESSPRALTIAYQEALLEWRGVSSIHPSPPEGDVVTYVDIVSGGEVVVVRGSSGCEVLRRGRREERRDDLAAFIRSFKLGRTTLCSLVDPKLHNLVVSNGSLWSSFAAALSPHLAASPLYRKNTLDLTKATLNRLSRPKLRLRVHPLTAPSLETALNSLPPTPPPNLTLSELVAWHEERTPAPPEVDPLPLAAHNWFVAAQMAGIELTSS